MSVNATRGKAELTSGSFQALLLLLAPDDCRTDIIRDNLGEDNDTEDNTELKLLVLVRSGGTSSLSGVTVDSEAVSSSLGELGGEGLGDRRSCLMMALGARISASRWMNA